MRILISVATVLLFAIILTNCSGSKNATNTNNSNSFVKGADVGWLPCKK
jgi:hypothetical protein